MVGMVTLPMGHHRTVVPARVPADHSPAISSPTPVYFQTTACQPVWTVHRDTRGGTVKRAWMGTLVSQGWVCELNVWNESWQCVHWYQWVVVFSWQYLSVHEISFSCFGIAQNLFPFCSVTLQPKPHFVIWTVQQLFHKILNPFFNQSGVKSKTVVTRLHVLLWVYPVYVRCEAVSLNVITERKCPHLDRTQT